MQCQFMVAEIGTEGVLVLARYLAGISNIILYCDMGSTPALSLPSWFSSVLATHPNAVNHRAQTDFFHLFVWL